MGNPNSGRRPQPTALKVLRGNPGKRKLNQQEPVPPAGPIVKPTLSIGAGLVWDRLAPIATAMGTLTAADVTAFATLCELQATLEAAGTRKDPVAPPADVIDPAEIAAALERVAVILADAIKTEKDFAPIIRPYYALFGLDPVSRAKIQVAKPVDTPIVSKWQGLLK
jgi:hypothetical protein